MHGRRRFEWQATCEAYGERRPRRRVLRTKEDGNDSTGIISLHKLKFVIYPAAQETQLGTVLHIAPAGNH